MIMSVNMEKLYNALKLSRDANIPCKLTAREATKLYGELMTLRGMLDILVKDSEWSSVKRDELLPIGKLVLVNTPLGVVLGKCIKIGDDAYQWNTFNEGGRIFYHDDDFDLVTHWKPLPSPPEDTDD